MSLTYCPHCGNISEPKLQHKLLLWAFACSALDFINHISPNFWDLNYNSRGWMAIVSLIFIIANVVLIGSAVVIGMLRSRKTCACGTKTLKVPYYELIGAVLCLFGSQFVPHSQLSVEVIGEIVVSCTLFLVGSFIIFIAPITKQAILHNYQLQHPKPAAHKR